MLEFGTVEAIQQQLMHSKGTSLYAHVNWMAHPELSYVRTRSLLGGRPGYSVFGCRMVRGHWVPEEWVRKPPRRWSMRTNISRILKLLESELQLYSCLHWFTIRSHSIYYLFISTSIRRPFLMPHAHFLPLAPRVLRYLSSSPPSETSPTVSHFHPPSDPEEIQTYCSVSYSLVVLWSRLFLS